MSPEERLLAYLDGELAPDQHAQFEAEVAADPVLAAEVAAHRGVASRIAEVYAPVLQEPVPPELIAMASAGNDRRTSSVGLPQWAAMAACLVIGVVAGRAAWPVQGPLSTHNGALVARGSLETALTTQLASENGVVKVGLTFKATDGRYCRTFQSARAGLAGLACRQRGDWAAETTTAFHPSAGTDYRTASSDTPPTVLAAVDALIGGAPLDANAERAARDGGWKP